LAKATLLRTASRVRELVGSWRGAHDTVALVPTMGNLHEGHLSLVRLAREHADRVIMSIYVNPTQFGAGEDFAAYPRTLEDDRALVDSGGGVDALFVPDDIEVYPFGSNDAVRLVMPQFANELCGASRPGHFDGVATVVCRLLNIVSPDVLLLGRKDYQQLKVVERMVADLRLPVRVEAGPTVRDDDGLAISSRNRYLTRDQRRHAPALHAALETVRQAVVTGERDYSRLQRRAAEVLEGVGFKPDYVEVRRSADLTTPNGLDEPGALIVLGAAWLGKARLIDNLEI
jgi:pantoate--beta-alanine ligase